MPDEIQKLPSTSKFEAPPDSSLPDELVGPAPRSLPDNVHEGPLAQKRKKVYWGCGAAGALCLLLGKLPFVDTLALYVLPLGYLSWIGIAVLVLGLISYVRAGEFKKASRYVEQGNAAFGKVISLVKVPTVVVEEQPGSYAFVASLQLIDPNSNETCLREVKSRDFSASFKDHIATSFRVGDFVPVVWLPNRLDESLQIYDFVELTPEASLVRNNTDQQYPLWQIVLIVLAVPLLFSVLFWNVYAHGRYNPIEFDHLQDGFLPMAIGSILGLTILLGSYFGLQRQKRQLAERNAAAIAVGKAVELAHESSLWRKGFMALVMIAGSILMGGLTMLCWCFTANALFDTSPPKEVPVQITEMTQTTHAMIFREYNMKYRLEGEKDAHSLLTTPEHLSQFVVPTGNALVREGRFNWKWVETVKPAFVIQAE